MVVQSWHPTVHTASSAKLSMHIQQAALLWSGGKDSALALHHVRHTHPHLKIVKLVTCLSQAYDRVSMHGVRRQLVQQQADSLGLPVEFVVIPHHDDPKCPMAHTTPGTSFPPNDTYTRTLLEALRRLKDEGVEVIVFGDIYLEDLRAFRDRLLAVAGLEGAYPLWGRDTRRLAAEMQAAGVRATVTCVDPRQAPASLAGRAWDATLVAELPEGVDPCGERGEFHTLATDGPAFRRPLAVVAGEVVERDGFVFADVRGAARARTPTDRVV